jgi:hypothetical protein
MVEQVCGLRDQRVLVLGERGDGHLDGFLAELLGRLDRRLVQQPAGMGVFGPRLPARLDDGGEPAQTSLVISWLTLPGPERNGRPGNPTKVGASARLPAA